MSEKLIGKVNNIEGKPKGSMIFKNCELIFTNKRILVNFTGPSVFINSMIGKVVNGVSGSIGLGIDAKEKNKKNESKGNNFNTILEKKDNYEITYENIDKDHSNFKTSFWNTLGMYASLIIKEHNNKKYFFRVTNNQKNIVKNYIKLATDKIKV